MMELRPIQAALLAGRFASRRATTNPSLLSYPLGPSFYRCFSTTRPSFSEAEAPAPAPTPSMTEWNRQQQERQQQQQQTQSGLPQRPAWGSAGKGLGTSGGIASLLTPNNSAPSPLSPSSSQSAPPPTTPSASPDPRRNPWASPSSPALRRSQEKRLATSDPNGKPPGIFEDLKDLLSAPGSEEMLKELNKLNSEPVSDVKYRLRPSIGRTVPINAKVDLARGLGLLNLRVRVNKVSQDVNRQRFHERPGLKRKRLRRERWRVRFKDGFKATCKRVQDLARQGW